MDYELENIKIKINIGEYAADLGWVIDEKESTPKSLVMAKDNRKIVVAKYQDLLIAGDSIVDPFDGSIHVF